MIRVFAIFLVVMGIGLFLNPSRTMKLLGWVVSPDESLFAKHRWNLRILGVVSVVVGGWILLTSHR
jgi:uncharacterized protein YjeT (DUF2065 family)